MSTQQPNPTTFTSFADWCLHKDSLSEAARYTVDALLNESNTSDCYEADRILSRCTDLYLIRNQIIDISPLSSLVNLTELELYENQITDISFLSSLPLMIYLDLHDNQITDISPLSSLVNLGEVHLDNNQITDFSIFQSMNFLQYVHMYGTYFTKQYEGRWEIEQP